MNTLFEMPKERKPRKQHVRTQRYICKRCKSQTHGNDCLGEDVLTWFRGKIQTHGNDFCMCWKFDIVIEFRRDGTAWTGNGNENIVCDGHDIQIGGVQ